MQPSKNNFLSAALIVVLVVSSFSLGFLVRGSQVRDLASITELSNKTESAAPVDFSPYWRAWRILNDKQIDSGDIKAQDRLWSSIKGLAQAYNDPYTVFLPPEEAREFEEEIRGNFSGVGMEVGIKDGVITVIAPLKNTPAEKAGIRAGDRVVRINKTSTANMTIDEAVEMIRGKEGTEVTLTVFREGVDEALEFSIKRAKIQIPTLDFEMRKDGVFVISLYNFTANVNEEFKEALQEFVRSGSDKLVLDLRGNPGGFLTAAVETASHFLPQGKVVVREVGKGDQEIRVLRSRGYKLLNTEGLSMVVLIDQGSASASEIVAGALAEHGVATLVGKKTFGKGSVQELISITPDTSIKVTVAKWMTPEGVSISEEGLEPDVEVDYEFDENNPDKDPQLDRAVEILLKN